MLGPATATVAGTLLGLLPRAGPLAFLRLHAGLLLVALVVGTVVAGIGHPGRAGSAVADDGGGWLDSTPAAVLGDGAARVDLGGVPWPLAVVALVGVGGLGGVAAIWAYDRTVRAVRPRARGASSRRRPGSAVPVPSPGWAWAGRPARTTAPGPGPAWVDRPSGSRVTRTGTQPATRLPRPATVTAHLVACAVLEELVFRGLLVWAALAVGGVGGAAALAAVTALFALSHAELGPGQALAFLPLSVIALALTLATGSVVPAVTAHVVVNVRAGVAAGRRSASRVPAGGWAR